MSLTTHDWEVFMVCSGDSMGQKMGQTWQFAKKY
jgi:hypothetical protein